MKTLSLLEDKIFFVRVSIPILSIFLTVCGDICDAQQGGRSFHIEEAQARYFDQWQSARTFALAGAAIATVSEASSLLGNPAGLSRLDQIQIDLSYDYNQTGAKDETSEYQHIGAALVAIPAKLLPGTAAFGWSGMQGGPRDFPINSEHRIENFHGGYAQALSDSIDFGYALMWSHNQVYSNIYNYEMENGLRHTFGFQYRLGQYVVGAFGFYGHGRYDSDFFELGDRSSTVDQYGFDVGVSRASNNMIMFLGLDYAEYKSEGGFRTAPIDIALGGDESGTSFTPKVGFEIPVSSWLTARFGARYLIRRYFFSREELSVLRGDANAYAYSLGIGIKDPLLFGSRIDAAMEQRELKVGTNRQLLVALSVPL